MAQGVTLSVTIEVAKSYGDPDDPEILIKVGIRNSGTSVTIDHEQLHDLFDVTEQASLLAVQPAADKGFSSCESSVLIGELTVAANGVTWGGLGIVTSPEESIQLLRHLKDLAQEAASLPIPARRA